MLVLVSPSKTINYKPQASKVKATRPDCIEDAKVLVKRTLKLGDQMASTLGISQKLAELNIERLTSWDPDAIYPDAAPAAWAYRGEVYFGLSVEQMSPADQDYARDHLRTVSGLYGLLRPTDMIMPYRLEMSARLTGPWGKNLYEYWGDRLTRQVEAMRPSFILNAASKEYSKAIIPKLESSLVVVDVTFLHPGKKGLQQKSTFSKYSRGLIARWALEQKPESIQDLQGFDAEGYSFSPELSTGASLVFVGPETFSIKGRFTKL